MQFINYDMRPKQLFDIFVCCLLAYIFFCLWIMRVYYIASYSLGYNFLFYFLLKLTHCIAAQ